MNLQVVIPARGGSKRLVGKNCLPLGNIPLIAHSISFAQTEMPGAVVYVNTEDPEIAEVAKEYGAQVTKRPIELAKDTTSTAEVLKQQLQWFDAEGISCDGIILLQATNPIRPKGLISEALACFRAADRSSLVSFSVLNKKFGLIDSSNLFHPENYEPGQRMQDLMPRYFENGLLYITRRSSLEKGEIITQDTYPFIIDHIGVTVDIDEANDLTYAEFILNHLNNYE